MLNIDVPDIPAAVRFYERALGLRLRRTLFDGTVAEMSGAPLPIFLLEKKPASSPGPAIPATRDYARHWTPVHLDITVTDLGAAIDRACDAGAVLEGRIHVDVWGRLATLGDPFGHGFCLIEWSASGYDAVADSVTRLQQQRLPRPASRSR